MFMGDLLFCRRFGRRARPRDGRGSTRQVAAPLAPLQAQAAEHNGSAVYGYCIQRRARVSTRKQEKYNFRQSV
jgi:hypothetical protein